MIDLKKIQMMMIGEEKLTDQETLSPLMVMLAEVCWTNLAMQKQWCYLLIGMMTMIDLKTNQTMMMMIGEMKLIDQEALIPLMMMLAEGCWTNLAKQK